MPKGKPKSGSKSGSAPQGKCPHCGGKLGKDGKCMKCGRKY